MKKNTLLTTCMSALTMCLPFSSLTAADSTQNEPSGLGLLQSMQGADTAAQAHADKLPIDEVIKRSEEASQNPPPPEPKPDDSAAASSGTPSTEAAPSESFSPPPPADKPEPDPLLD